MFAIVSMMRITGVEISKMSKCAKQTANRKVLKHCKSYIHCVRHVGNDDLNYVCHSSHDTHYRSRNFEKVKIRKTNGKWRKQCISDLQCFKTFRSAVCFAHLDFLEISTPVMCIMKTLPNIV